MTATTISPPVTRLWWEFDVLQEIKEVGGGGGEVVKVEVEEHKFSLIRNQGALQTSEATTSTKNFILST